MGNNDLAVQRCGRDILFRVEQLFWLRHRADIVVGRAAMATPPVGQLILPGRERLPEATSNTSTTQSNGE